LNTYLIISEPSFWCHGAMTRPPPGGSGCFGTTSPSNGERTDEFRLATEASGRGWRQYDVAPIFAEWIATQSWFERIAKRPSQLERVIPDFESELVQRLRSELSSCSANDLLAVMGVASLFGLTRASSMIAQVASTVRGRMVVTFPGTHVNGIYRLLDARDGWNYHAIPIPAADAA
jgi:hypothetical protein